MEADEAISLCDEILKKIDELPERAEDFGDSVKTKVEDMQIWIEEHNTVTAAQAKALENMNAGVYKWLERS